MKRDLDAEVAIKTLESFRRIYSDVLAKYESSGLKGFDGEIKSLKDALKMLDDCQAMQIEMLSWARKIGG